MQVPRGVVSLGEGVWGRVQGSGGGWFRIQNEGKGEGGGGV